MILVSVTPFIYNLMVGRIQLDTQIQVLNSGLHLSPDNMYVIGGGCNIHGIIYSLAFDESGVPSAIGHMKML